MKKNKMMRLASVLLVAVILTTCAISGTYAKYVTSKNGSDSARVAKWGVGFTVSSDLFDKTYNKDDPTYTSMQYSVKSNDNVVAPGTSGNAYSFETTGTPEVSYRVTFAQTTGTTPETVFLGASSTYYPVNFTLKYNNSEVTISSQDIATVLATVAKCAYYFDVTDGKYYVSTDGGTSWSSAQDSAPKLELSWAWDFDASGAGTNDAKDTALGDLAAGKPVAEYPTDGTDYNLDVKFDITATATQID